jgi:hypothetical protein
MNHRSEVEIEVEGTDMVEVHEHLMNHRPEVKGMDREDNGMGEDMMVEVKVVEREHVGMVLVRHWTSDGAMMSRRARREQEEFAKSGCSRGHTRFTCRDSNCST